MKPAPTTTNKNEDEMDVKSFTTHLNSYYKRTFQDQKLKVSFFLHHI